MPPDPVGARPGLSPTLELDQLPAGAESPVDFYDRSSLRGDFMVMIDGQTEADFWLRAPDTRCEFIDGIVYMPPSGHANHQFDFQSLLWLISVYHAHHPVGVIQSGPTILKLRDDCLLEPDLFVLPLGTEAQIRADGYVRTPVLLAVEILSPSTRSHDLVVKSALYRAANVAEIWFVDRRDRVVIVERWDGATYRTERFESGPVVSRALLGFWFDVSWLWAEPEPNRLACLNQILAGPPRG